jgi:hypothetical protein
MPRLPLPLVGQWLEFLLRSECVELAQPYFRWLSRFWQVKFKDPMSVQLPQLIIGSGGYCGRAASYPTDPAQIPACGTTAPGFSEILASAKALRQTGDKDHPNTSWAADNVRFHHAELVQ